MVESVSFRNITWVTRFDYWLLLYHLNCLFVCFWRDSPSGPGPPHSRGFEITLDDAPQSVGLLWTSDQLVAETL